MDTILKQCCIVIAVMAFLIGLSSGECPASKQMIQKNVETCFSEIGLNSQALASTDMDSVKALCRDQVYKRAISCLRQIYDSCIEQKDIQAFLNKLINFDHYDSAFTYICDNVHVLEANTECIEKVASDGAAMICVQTAAKRFETEIAAKTNTGEFNPQDTEAIFPLLCKYMDSVVACTIRPYETCGDDVMDIMARTFKLVIPNVCNELRAGVAGVTSSVVVVLCSLFTAISMMRHVFV